jgi:hypothetical protein
MHTNLHDFRGRATIGSQGRIRVAGAGVRPKHAEIAICRNNYGGETMVVRPLQGAVSVGRGGATIAVLTELDVRDGDLLVLGERRLRFWAAAGWPATRGTRGR